MYSCNNRWGSHSRHYEYLTKSKSIEARKSTIIAGSAKKERIISQKTEEKKTIQGYQTVTSNIITLIYDINDRWNQQAKIKIQE